MLINRMLINRMCSDRQDSKKARSTQTILATAKAFIFQYKSFYNLMTASLTVTRSVTEIQNLLACDVCKETINEPKILPCSHSFCKACLENLTTRNEENIDGVGTKLDCPTCTSTVTLKTNENVVGLPDNEFIAKLLTAVGTNRQQEAAICFYCKKEPSITIYMECELLLCHKCYCSHDTWPRNKSHTMITISEIINHDEQQRIGAETLSYT